MQASQCHIQKRTTKLCHNQYIANPNRVGIYWKGERAWKLYPTDIINSIIAGVLNGAPCIYLGIITSSEHPMGQPYIVDLLKMKQINVSTGTKRDVVLIDSAGNEIRVRDAKFHIQTA